MGGYRFWEGRKRETFVQKAFGNAVATARATTLVSREGDSPPISFPGD